MTLSILCIECHYAEWHNLFNVMLSVFILNVIILSVVAPAKARTQSIPTADIFVKKVANVHEALGIKREAPLN
jgi:hypothetical protein